ncbi:hypothetical protein G1C97_1361 [Bifidobacterium sp. DSM 109959]|uniref:Uncharacterized protein n=1 Tax=Bifidobacterium olomucense TaxID=2675324 RepID=A0A7Y0EXY4_9BIFI|nr:hypothetical protein [Bifidobacterium sp. DSM 109959]
MRMVTDMTYTIRSTRNRTTTTAKPTRSTRPAQSAPPAYPRLRSHPASPTIPPILLTKDLPGPLSLNRLAEIGTVHKLDESAGYWAEHADTLYGRARIVAKVVPFGTVPCMMTAAWVWLNGIDFPETLDVISTSHFRTASVGRRIRVFKRLTLPEQIIKIGGMPITTPARTACDLVMVPNDIPSPSLTNTLVCRLMSAYAFQPSDCLRIIREHRHHKFAGRARLFFESIQREIDDRPEAEVGSEAELGCGAGTESGAATQTESGIGSELAGERPEASAANILALLDQH